MSIKVIERVVQSTGEPNKNDLWLTEGENPTLKIHNKGGWKSVAGGGGGGPLPENVVTTDQLETALATKVDAVSGKGLSTNDYDDTEKAKVASAYEKPSTGIPKTDLAQGVQSSLDKADTAYQKPQTGIPASDLAPDAIPSGITLLELSSDIGTLTSEQLALVQTNNCVIKYTGNTSGLKGLYHKSYDSTEGLDYNKIQETKSNDDVRSYYFTCIKSTGEYNFGTDTDARPRVVGNPTIQEGTTPTTLLNLRIGFTDYAIPQGGGGGGTDPNAVHFTQQSLTAEQQTQARTNIGAGTYSKPTNGIPASDMEAGAIPSVPVQDVTVGGTSVVSDGTAAIPSIPDAVEANPTVPSGTTPTALSGLKVGSSYYSTPDVSGKEDTSNKVTSLSAQSTDTQYPSAKAVVDYVDEHAGGGEARIGNSVPAPETLILVDYYSESEIPSAKGTVIDGTIKVNFDGFILEKYAQAEVQGNSSASNPKKNLTFALFDDDQYSEEYELRIGNMVPHSEFVFKANYGDAAQVRNTGCNKLWEQVIFAHDNPPYRGNEGVYPYDTGALCHVDGFPCVLYFNDTFYGIGWWNIGKKRNNYDMGKNNQNQIQLQAEPRVDLTAPYSSTYWETRNPATPDEYFEGKVNAWLTDNAKTGDTFKEDFADHHNVRNAIDYFIFVEFIYDEDGLDNNIMLTTWDGSEFWMLPYDLDSSLGLTYNGTATTPYNESVTETTMGGNAMTANTRAFWRKFRDAFKAELSERYRELKDLGIFTVANINRIVSDAQRRYGKDNFALEAAAWPNIPSLNITSKMQILNWVKNRIAWMDTYYKVADVPVESISIDNGTQAGTNKYRYIATVSPANATDKRVTWSVESGSSYATIDQQGVVTVLEGADADTVVIRATSVADSTIYADKTIEVTYEEPLTYDVDYDKQSLSGTSADYEEYQNVHLLGDSETQWSMFVLLPAPPVTGGSGGVRTLLSTQDSSGTWDGLQIDADSQTLLVPKITDEGNVNYYINPGTGQVVQGSPYGQVSYSGAVPLVISRNGTTYKYSMDGVTWNNFCTYASPSASSKAMALQIGGMVMSGTPDRFPATSGPARVALILGQSEYGFAELFAEYQ